MKRVNPRLTPDEQKLQETKEKAWRARQERLNADYNEAFGSAAGKAVLRDLAEVAGFVRSDIVANRETGEIQLKGSLYNMAFRNFYLKIRSRVRPEILRDVEYKNVQEDVSAEADMFS